MGRFRGGCGHPRRRPRPPPLRPRSRLIRTTIPWFWESPTMLPTPPSRVSPECEAAVNSHAALELHASFQCLAVASYLNRVDVALKHFSYFFLLRSHEHGKTTESLIFLQNQRGGRICFLNCTKPKTRQWESGIQAIQDVLHLETCVNQSLLNLHQLATDSSDAHLCHFLGTGYLDEQVKFIKQLGDYVSILSNMGAPEGALAEYFFDKLTLGDGDQKD